jgi:hypothetical protein
MKYGTRKAEVLNLLQTPKKQTSIRIPEGIFKRFKELYPNFTAGIIEAMIDSIPELKGSVRVHDIKKRNPSYWPGKNMICRNAVLLELGNQLQRSAVDPKTFEQAMELGFRAEEELENLQEKDD